jgi:2'-hydroxyisoflavone reductase
MDLLLIGGTHFVGRHVVEQAVAAGHQVTVFHRGASEPGERYPDVEHVHGDRDADLGSLRGRSFDWVVDVCGYVPRVVRGTVELAAAPRYLFVSTESVYAEPLPPVVDERSPLATLEDPTVEEVTWQTYGPLKVLCEQVVVDAYGERALLVRPGYVVGPHDPTDRFTWWMRRAAAGGAMPAPDGPDYPVQLTDGRDLGAFMVRLIEAGANGAFNADGPPVPLGDLLDSAARVAGTRVDPVWIPERWLSDHGFDDGVAFPIWESGDGGRARMDASKAVASGLTHRDLESTIRDTLAWDRARGLPELAAGLSPEREAELLAAFG